MSVRVASDPGAGRSVKVNEYSRVNMTCVVDANPPVIGQPEWSKGRYSCIIAEMSPLLCGIMPKII